MAPASLPTPPSVRGARAAPASRLQGAILYALRAAEVSKSERPRLKHRHCVRFGFPDAFGLREAALQSREMFRDCHGDFMLVRAWGQTKCDAYFVSGVPCHADVVGNAKFCKQIEQFLYARVPT